MEKITGTTWHQVLKPVRSIHWESRTISSRRDINETPSRQCEPSKDTPL